MATPRAAILSIAPNSAHRGSLGWVRPRARWPKAGPRTQRLAPTRARIWSRREAWRRRSAGSCRRKPWLVLRSAGVVWTGRPMSLVGGIGSSTWVKLKANRRSTPCRHLLPWRSATVPYTLYQPIVQQVQRTSARPTHGRAYPDDPSPSHSHPGRTLLGWGHGPAGRIPHSDGACDWTGRGPVHADPHAAATAAVLSRARRGVERIVGIDPVRPDGG